MKALIAAGGHATRLRPITYTINKHLIPLANKTMIEHAIEKIVECGITEIAININPGEMEIQKAIGDGSRWNVRMTYLEQIGGAKGLGHIIANASSWIGDHPFLFYLGDNIILESIKPLADRFVLEQLDCLLGLSEVKDPQRFGVPEIRGGRITRVIEKPTDPPSQFAVTGIYFFKPCALDAAREIRPSDRGEYEITDLITWLINHTYAVGYEEITGWWKDTGKPEDLIEGNSLLLDRMTHSEIAPDAMIAEDIHIEGIVRIGSGTIIESGSRIIGPACIGDRCHIQKGVIGPHVSIGNDVRIEQATISDSIVMDGCEIQDGHPISYSVFGRNVRALKTVSRTDGSHRCLFGDNTLVEW
ncbi:MAG: glucose-1-phosphate thymidylyltransferase [Patescibacteria group bacterium]